MKDVIEVNPKTCILNLSEEDLVSFVPMANVQEKNNVVFYDRLPYKKVKKGFTIFQRGDIIWAKITPCMQNGKSCVLNDNMPTEIGFGSTEFHVLRKKTDKVYMPYIWAIFSNDNILKAAQGVFSGSAGQQRVSASFIENFPAVLPDYDMQVDLVAKLEAKLAVRNIKLNETNKLLQGFENSVSKKFCLNTNVRNGLSFAIRLKQLDGVIDVKRYQNIGTNHKLTLGDVCDIVEQKVNASSFSANIIDWIRIDDLPNSPLDIEQVRTQQANEIEGSFFEVKENDILLARLGPTILNKKIVLVRKLQRQTIASSEFLVLRCKEGYNPEAVMAILKTDYYKNLMYAYARGSTPSRYRLNREDALKLPFPIIGETQDDLAQKAFVLRTQVKLMRERAEQEWQEAKAQFEKMLLSN